MAEIPPHPLILSHVKVRPQWRRNPTTGQWVILAPARGARPILLDDDRNPPDMSPLHSCPFCAGHEWNTPPELFAYREPDSLANGPGWHVRVVPNQFAVVQPEGELRVHGDGFFLFEDGVGQHELIIECPHHETNFARLPETQIVEVVQAWHTRLEYLSQIPHLRYGQLFKNQGRGAGASVGHCHSQLIATPLVPALLDLELHTADSFFKQHGTCLFCDLIAREHVEGSRVVLDTREYLVVTAFAGRQPFETWIVPKHHRSHFDRLEPASVADLGRVIAAVLKKLDAALNDPPFNLLIHTSPYHEPDLEHYHWHVEIIPRLTQAAGYEWATNLNINPVLPEDAAHILKDEVLPNY